MGDVLGAAASHRAALLRRVLCALALAVVLGGCATGHPRPIGARALAEVQTFPYYKLYWAGPSFAGHAMVAADGQKDYVSSLGTSVYYGDCVRSKGIFGGGTCMLPLQVTTVIYRLHSNATLGAQRNTVLRGVPATIYDGGRTIELYSGRLAIDVFSDTPAHALAAIRQLRPLNSPGSAPGRLPPPVYCPGLSGPQPAGVRAVMQSLPARACQRAHAQTAYIEDLYR
jgi:hypothetical protein